MSRLHLVAAAVVLSLSPSAHAGDLSADLTAAREALASSQPDAALKRIESARAAAAELPQAANATLLARSWHYEGVALLQKGDEDGYMDAWRQALVIDNGYKWDEKLVEDSAAWSVFEALRGEVRSRPKLDTQVPEKTGAAKIYIDGSRARAGDTVLQGTHLGQIECPDGAFFGEWTDLKRKVRWFKMCPGGVDTSVVVAADSGGDDEWGDFGFAGGDMGGGDDVADGSDDAASDPAPVTSVAPGTGGQQVEVVRKNVVWPAFFAGVGTAAAAGALQMVALNQNARYNDLSNPDGLSVAELESLRKSTNRNQTLVYPLLAVSGGLFFAATYQW